MYMAAIRLGDVAAIQFGLILSRKKADNSSAYAYKKLTLRAMESGGINPEAVELFYASEPLSGEYMTRVGTLIMKLFAPFNPIVITMETEGYLFPSQMVSIKPLESILPEYLRIYLSQEFVADCLLANYTLIAQKAVTVDYLSNLEVRIPSLEKQKIICDYYGNFRHLSQLRKDLEKEEKAVMKHVFSVFSKEKERCE